MYFQVVLLLLLFAAGCSRAPPCGEEFVNAEVNDRIQSQVQWGVDDCDLFIASAIEKEMSAETAIQIALLNNPRIQATFEELEVSRADLLEAGLLSNPLLQTEIRYPTSKGIKTNIEYLLTTSVIDIFLLPLRTKLASTEYEKTRAKVTNEILDLAFDVRETFFELLAEQRKNLSIQSQIEIRRLLQEIASKQYEAGNIYSLEIQSAKTRNLEAELALMHSEEEIIRLMEKLTRLLGFSEKVCLLLPGEFPELDICGFQLSELESIALDRRLDLEVARLEVKRLSDALLTKSAWTYTNLVAGISGEREPDGENLIGPGFSLEIPLFNYGQADRMRLSALLRQAENRLDEKTIQVLSEVREAHKRLMISLNIIENYRLNLLPLTEQISTSSEELYNVMGLGIDQLLQNKLQEVVTRQNTIESMKKYLVARVALDRALGGYLFELIYCREEDCL